MAYPVNYPQDPALIWKNFYELTQIPHPSRQEAQLRAHIIAKAKKLGFKHKVDAKGNLVVYVPASPGKENLPVIILQAHLDMVAAQLPERNFNFSKDGLSLMVQDGWLKADGTTLGADDGIGVAAALAVMEDASLAHPPLELLFTIEEEIGLYGALAFEASLLKGRRLINLDMEEWGSLYTGCAGSIQYFLKKDLKLVRGKKEFKDFVLTMDGLAGGHSGTEIHLGRANAIKLLADIFNRALAKRLRFEIGHIQAGSAHNVIPRDAKVNLRIPAKDLTKWFELVGLALESWHRFLGEADQDLKISLVEQTKGTKETKKTKKCRKQSAAPLVLAAKDQQQLIDFLTLMPTGAYDYAWPKEGPVVNYSSNLAVLKLDGKSWQIITSLRFLDEAQVMAWQQQLATLTKIFGVRLKRNAGYPPWKPSQSSQLLSQATDIYTQLFGAAPQIKVIHAGLECGIFKSKIADLDMISLGPTMVGVHSPREALDIESVQKMWQLLTALMAAI